MKIYKLLILLVFIITAVSCDDNEELYVLNPQGSGEITAPQSGFSQVLNPVEEQTNTAFVLVWNPADYGIPVETTYDVEFAKTGTDFAEPILAGSTSNTNMSWTVGDFNTKVVGAGLSPFVEGNMDIRIVSTVGSGSAPQISESITVLITPFTTDLPTIAVPGNHQGWNPPTAPLLAASAFGATDYEGYVWLDGEYKFIGRNQNGEFVWDESVDWGDDGSFAGKLVAEDEVNCKEDVAGYYYVKADTSELTYSTKSVSWGIIGSATPTGWDSDTDLIYDAASRTLSVDIDLVGGEFKFRGNNVWDQFDLGTVDDDGFLQSGGNLPFDGASGNYHVVLDLSNPRAYTYSLVKN